MVELLQLAVRANDKFRGISIGDSVIKLLQYADNTTGVLRDEVSLKMLLEILKSFGKISGLDQPLNLNVWV